MIRLLIQHAIFEVCIEQLFDKLMANFGWLNWSVKIQSVGDHLKIRVSGLKYDVVLTKCVVQSKDGDKMIIRSEDNPRHIWITIEQGKIVNIAGDEKVIIDTFMDIYK